MERKVQFLINTIATIKSDLKISRKIFSFAACLFLFFLSLNLTVSAQDESCGSTEHLSILKQSDPTLQSKIDTYEQQIQQWIADNPQESRSPNSVITIPVVIHVVYKNSTENISNTLCNQVIQELNQDYSRTNPDSHLTPAVWQSIAANPGIQFCLAQRTPTGAVTNGIERRQTTVQQFYYTNNKMKFFSTGGLDAWNVKKYMNIWICDVDVSFSEFPTGSASNTYGSVCRYGFLGLGKWVVTHEIGHSLNLRHIWGDDGGTCSGSDLVSDTPNQANKTTTCPGPFPQTDACSPNNPGIMFMNYMDYTPGYCSGSCSGCDSRNLFTNGQKARMLAVLNNPPYNALKTSNGCTPVTPAAPPIPTLSTNACGPKTLTRATPPSGVLYYWQGTSCGTSTANSASTYTVNTSGTYYLRARYTNGTWSTNCSSKIVTINPIPNIPPIPSVTANPCGSQTLTRAVPPTGITFYWQGTSCGSSTSNSALTYAASSTATYFIRAKSSAGCWSACDSVAVTVHSSPSPVITGQNAVCSNASGVIYSVINSGNNYFWSVIGGTIASGQNTNSIHINWGTAGVGTVTITETNQSTSCSKTVSFTVNINSSLNPLITANSSVNFCQGHFVVLDASSGFTSYLWSNGDTTQTISVANSGTFTVSVTAANGCTGTSSTPVSVTVYANPLAVINPVGVTTFCEGDSALLSTSSIGVVSYLWSNGGNSQSISVSDSGSYTVTIVDTNGCSATSAATIVTIHPLPPTPSITEYNDTLVSSSSTGNQWYLNTDTLIYGATSNFYIPSQNGNYTVTVTDSSGCSATSAEFNYSTSGIETMPVSVEPQPEITIYPNPNDGKFTVESLKWKVTDITIYNMIGEKIYSLKKEQISILYPTQQQAGSAFSIDLISQPPGIYFVQLLFGNKIFNKKIVLQ